MLKLLPPSHFSTLLTLFHLVLDFQLSFIHNNNHYNQYKSGKAILDCFYITVFVHLFLCLYIYFCSSYFSFHSTVFKLQKIPICVLLLDDVQWGKKLKPCKKKKKKTRLQGQRLNSFFLHTHSSNLLSPKLCTAKNHIHMGQEIFTGSAIIALCTLVFIQVRHL